MTDSKEIEEMPTTMEEKFAIEMEATGSIVEAAGGVAVVVLAIISLARGDTQIMTSIADIVLGVTLLAQGGTIATEYSRLLTMITGGTLGAVALGGGMTIEVLAGGAAAVLGVLALLGFAPMVLVPAAVIAVGGTLILSAGAVQRLNELKVQVEARDVPEIAQRVSQGAVSGATAAQVLVGIAAIVLGIIALASTVNAAVLTQVGLLVLGAAVTLSGTALAGRMARMFGH
jgi:hypothetical protein